MSAWEGSDWQRQQEDRKREGHTCALASRAQRGPCPACTSRPPDWRAEAGISRRACIDRCTPVENAIRDVMGMIERMPADERLTKAQIKLDEARNLVADFVDQVLVSK